MDQLETFIRPPRFQYNSHDLGPLRLNSQNCIAIRHELTVKNLQNDNLSVTYFECIPRSQFCIIYCHGYNGCQVEGIRYAQYAIQKGINFCTFDFQACGKSEGRFISFGHKEKNDIQSIIDYVHKYNYVNQFILWGRSLGATTIQLKTFQNVIAVILDSSFIDLRKTAIKMINQQTPIPKLLVKTMFFFLKGEIEDKAGFKFEDIKVNDQSELPTLFLYSEEDTLVKPKNTINLYRNHKGEKQILKLSGNHNSTRNHETILKVIDFADNQFRKTFKYSIIHAKTKLTPKQYENQNFRSLKDTISPKNPAKSLKNSITLQLKGSLPY
ncbi:hypothetical protein pb186bvf_005743 [Paramecium bursaria]